MLELACDSGRVTRHIRHVLPAGVEFWATDLNGDMLDIAKLKLGNEQIKFQTEDIQNIAFADNTFDVVICQFGIMFLPDKQKGFDEIYRVLMLAVNSFALPGMIPLKTHYSTFLSMNWCCCGFRIRT